MHALLPLSLLEVVLIQTDFFSAHVIQKIRISVQAYNRDHAQRQFFQKYRISQSDIFMQKARSLIGTDLSLFWLY